MKRGRSGAWNNITQADKEDGKRFLFINDSISAQKDKEEKSTQQIDVKKENQNNNDLPRTTYSGRKITKAYLEKLERSTIFFI